MVIATKNSGNLVGPWNDSMLVFAGDTKKYIADTIAAMVGGIMADIDRRMDQMANDVSVIKFIIYKFKWNL